MTTYQMGGGLKLLTALEKTQAFAEFLQTRMTRALEAEDDPQQGGLATAVRAEHREVIAFVDRE